jgi:hypothetical protein
MRLGRGRPVPLLPLPWPGVNAAAEWAVALVPLAFFLAGLIVPK